MLGLEGLLAWGRDETVRKPCMCEKRMRKSCTRCTRGSIIEGPTCAQHETQLSGIGSVWPAGHDYLSCRAPHSKCSHQPDPRCPVDLGFLQAPVVHGVVYAGVCVCVRRQDKVYTSVWFRDAKDLNPDSAARCVWLGSFVIPLRKATAD